MRILLTGAAGFTGRHFDQHARLAGHDLVHLSADLTQPVAVMQAVQAVGPLDAVVHLAAMSFVGHADTTAFYSVNTVGTCNLLSALAAMPSTDRPRTVLVASSANVYGNCQQSPISETQPPAPVNHYAASKLAMEHMALTFSDRLPILITRPFNYTGPGQAASFLIPKLVDHFQRRAPVIELGNLEVEREFNDVRLVSTAYLELLEKGCPGEIYNVCSGQPHSLLAVLAKLATLTDHHPDIKVNPAYVRANEVHRLCGDPGKLQACIGKLKKCDLNGLLKWMIDFKISPYQS